MQDVVLIIGLTSLPKQFKFSSGNGIYKYLVNQCYYFLTLQNYSFIILTVCLIRIPSMILDNFNKEITLTKTASINQVVDLVAKWKENWLVVCDLVVDVNDFIGWPLFVYIIYGFFIFVSYTFTIFFRILTDEGLSLSFSSITMYFVLKFFAYICLLAFEAEKLPSKVNDRMSFDHWSTKMNPVFNFQVSNISDQLIHVKVT